MARPAHKTTESTRKHTFRSFKERVDTLKIDPGRKLNTRAYDYVESSHFLVTLQHWKEVNLSGDFTGFVFEIQSLCQTLPHIIHHQAKIFALLERHIGNNDIHSLQPLLELMTQFIHDLGPDFMTYYKVYLGIIFDLTTKLKSNDSQNMTNTSNVLEWAFNSMAFAFKYLARNLVMDLRPTFLELFPFLTSTKKNQVSRFCAEAFSFLMKKSKQNVLEDVIDIALYEKKSELDTNQSYRESLAILFSESMKNTAETFHSKAHLLLSILVTSALNPKGGDVQVNTVCDTLLQIFQHGTTTSCEKFFNLCMDIFDDIIKSTESHCCLQNIMKLLITISFSESGSRVSNWTRLLDTVKSLLARADSLLESGQTLPFSLIASTSHLFSVVVRNSNVQTLNKAFHFMAEFLSERSDCRYFFSFYELSLKSSGNKILEFGINKYLQTVVSKMNTEEELSCAARFFILLSDHSGCDFSNITLPPSVSNRLSDMIYSESGTLEDSTLMSFYWKLRLASYVPPSTFDPRKLMEAFESTKSDRLTNSTLLGSVRGLILSLLVSSSKQSSELLAIFQNVKDTIELSRQSIEYVDGVKSLIHAWPGELSTTIEAEFAYLCSQFASNLSAPNKILRCQTINCLESIYKCVQKSFPSLLANMRLIDQIPLEVMNANDIKLRIRILCDEFSEQVNKGYEENLFLVNFIIGLLSDNFRPCWLAVYEHLPKLAKSGCSDQLWNIFVNFLTMDYEVQSSLCPCQEPMSIEATSSDASQFATLDMRLNQNILAASSTIFRFTSEYEASIFDALRDNYDLQYKSNMRSRIISAVQAVTFVAESHGSQLIELVHELYKFSGDDDNNSSCWSAKERLQLMTTFAKFKGLKRLKGNEILFKIVLDNISSRVTDVQKESLDIVFAWNNQQINKYRDNLKNLLDDKLFRDELQMLVSKDSDSKIEDADRSQVIPIILRILYGRAKGSSNNNDKNGRKSAIASILPNFPDEYILQFLSITTEKIAFANYFSTKQLNLASTQDMRNMQGYLNFLLEVYIGLGYKYANLLKETIKPLMFTLISIQKVIDTSDVEDLTSKKARNLRQSGFNCLDHLFKITANSYDWKEESDLMYNAIVKPRLADFTQENLQQPSSLLQVVVGWIGAKSLLPFLYYDNFAPVTALMSLLAHPDARDSVRSLILDFCISAFTKKYTSEQYVTVLAMVVDGLLKFLPTIIQESTEREINSRSSTLLLLIIEGNYVSDQIFMKNLVISCSAAIDKPPTQISSNDKVSLLLSLTPIISQLECSFDEIKELYECVSRALRVYVDRDVRDCLVKIMAAIGSKFPEYLKIGDLLKDLNSYSAHRLSEPDFAKRINAFKIIIEDPELRLTPSQWTPIIYCCLFFMNDPDEFVLRSNAASTIIKYIDCLNSDTSLSAEGGATLLHSVILPNLKNGFKKDSDAVREGYIQILSHLVRNHTLSDEFASMKILLSEDDELDFFKNFTHIQVSCRLDAMRRLKTFVTDLDPNAVYYYILPMTEIYTISHDEKYRDLVNETVIVWSLLVRKLNWQHFRQIFRKKIQAVSKAPSDDIQHFVPLVVHMSCGLLESIKSLSGKNECKDAHFTNLPDDNVKLDKQIMDEFHKPMMKILKLKDDSTLIARTGLLEAVINCLLCVSNTIAESAISGTLTSTCQALRSKSQQVRNEVRNALGKVTSILGPKYFKFIVKELKSALTRGSHIHVLSYTLHDVLDLVSQTFVCGDLDESASLIASVIMEDIFGAAGKEKDAADYKSKMKEVKAKKSFETGRILASLISLPYMHYLIEPIKLLLKQNLPLKTKQKLEKLIHCYATGLQDNPNSSKIDILILCYEIYTQSLSNAQSIEPSERREVDDHFLVKLSSKLHSNNFDRSQSLYTLQKLSFSLLSSALTKHESLQTVTNLDGFLPRIEESLKAEDETLLISIYKVLEIFAKIPFPQSKDSFFEYTASRAFEIIQNMPSTSNELCQVCLQYVATVIESRGTVEVNDTAIIYLLVRIMPDLEEPAKQRRAFHFLEAVISQHVMLPEVYDIMEKVFKIMIVNHDSQIRETSRTLYFQFLMEYEHSSAKLDKSFKFLVNNLAYPTQSGRQSVLELMHLIISKSPSTLVEQLATSFFIGLANVAVSDDSSTCREMSSILISELFKNLSDNNLTPLENFCFSWITQENNDLLKRCGLIVYKLYATSKGIGKNVKLDTAAFESISEVISNSKNGSHESTLDWEMVYTAMNVFLSMCEHYQKDIFSKLYEETWLNILETMLYPHSWVRYLSSRLIGTLLSNLDNVPLEISAQQIQNIAFRSVRQLNAPGISQKSAQQVVRNLINIVTRWESEKTPFLHTSAFEEAQADGEVQVYKLATDYVIAKICLLMRQSNSENDYVAKLAAIQLGAMICQIAAPERLFAFAKQLMLGLFNILESEADTDERTELKNMADECLKILKERLGMLKFGEIQISVRREVSHRRSERRAHKAQLTINAPDIAAKRRMKKNEKFRQKRKRDRNDEGPGLKRKHTSTHNSME